MKKLMSSNQRGMSMIRTIIVIILLIVLFTVIFFIVTDTSEFRKRFEPESEENQTEVELKNEIIDTPKPTKTPVVNPDGSINY